MKPPIKDGVVLLTGASAGIGREMALMLAAEARTLILVARRRERLEALAEELRGVNSGLEVVVAPCDLGDRAAVDEMLAEVGSKADPVDVLINNAGFGDIALMEDADFEKLDLMIRVNCTSLTYLTHKLLPAMIERKRGGILNISSGFGMTFTPGVGVYAATKHYVTAFTEVLRQEMRAHRVVVTQSCPGPVATEFESVAGNPTGQAVPSLIEISAETCARQSLRGFERDRAMVMPGFVMPLIMNLGRMTPRWVWRPLSTWMAGYLRKRRKA